MWVVFDDIGNEWNFDDKDSMIEFLDNKNSEGLVNDNWWVEYDYFDRSKANDSYPVTDFVFIY